MRVFTYIIDNEIKILCWLTGTTIGVVLAYLLAMVVKALFALAK